MTRSALPLFLGTAVRRPVRVGAVAPSGRGLTAQLAAVVPRAGEPTVVELGAGSGAASWAVLDRLPERGHHLAVDSDPGFAEYLRGRLPGSDVVQADAADLARLVDDPVDAVVCTLPWSLITAGKQRQILDAVCAVLAPGAAFATISYRHTAALPATRRFGRLLRERFDEVVPGRTVWRNIPPATVLFCRRPRRVG